MSEQREVNFYLDVAVIGRIVGMVNATSLRAAKKKLLALSREVDWIEIDLREVKG